MIYVFKTSIKTKKKLKEVTPILDKILHDTKWNVDLIDKDHVLRIDTNRNIPPILSTTFFKLGIELSELY